MRREEYQQIEAYMQRCMTDAAHDREHIYRVLYNALEIAASEPETDLDVLVAACLLHDIGREKEYADPHVCHAEAGAEMALEYLLGRGWLPERAGAVANAIRTHRYRQDRPPVSLEGKILFDADKLDVVGAIGIARTISYCGHVGEPYYTTDEDGMVLDGSGQEPPSVFQEYHRKLKRLYEGFYTARGRELAAARRRHAEELYAHLLEEVRTGRAEGKLLLERILQQ